MKYLIYGGKGWIGQQICEYLKTIPESTIILAKSRADNSKEVEKEILEIKPDRIISFIGRTHGPGYSTIDYLEQKGKLEENLRDNLYGPFVLAFMGMKYDIHVTYSGTGCIYSGYNSPDGTFETINENSGFTEKDKPNYNGSQYSEIKKVTDQIMDLMENYVLNLRFRMPIAAQNHSRNFITKIMNYPKICSIPNSMTVLPEMIPIMIDMIHKKTTGTFNFTNPGLISHNEILEMVREIIDPNFKWQNFTIEEQRKVLLADRSNNYLNTKKLEKLYPNITPIKEAVRKIIIEMRNLI